MRKMLNTLYVLSEDAYVTLDGETVEINFKEKDSQRVPLHTLENIIVFSYKGASPALMGKCEEYGISMCFFTPNGKYLASIGAAVKGNVYLRRTQYRYADNERESLNISRNMILGKLHNSRQVLLRLIRDHSMQVDESRINQAINRIDDYLKQVKLVQNKDSLRGIEGLAASEYFGVFDELVLRQKDIFEFKERSRRPPLDRINAMLSFAYVLLANECASALLSAGLDPYVGFFHVDRAGRKSLALDLMEEFRSIYADRFVLTLINNQIIKADDFIIQDSGAVLLKDDAKRIFISKWQERKRTEIMHPFLKEKIPWGLAMYVQALLLARYLREDFEQYPPFFWR